MKKFLFLVVVSIFGSSCVSDTENTMTVTGNVKGLKKGVLYLQSIPDSTLITIDSLEIDGNGNFSFKTELESPEIFYLYLNKKDNNNVNDRITFFGEPGIITINTSWNTFDANATIEGSPATKKLEEFKKVMSRFNKNNIELLQLTLNQKNKFDSIQRDSIQRLSAKRIKREYAYALNFALNNKNSFVAPYIAITETPQANVKYLDSIYNALSHEVADSKYGKELKEHIANIKALK